MRTTNKLIKDQIQEHVLEAINKEMTIQDVVNNFYTEKYSSAYERKQNKQEAFIDWMQGLPSSLNIEYTNYGIHNTMKKWFENAGEEYKPHRTMEESDLYFNLVTREFRNLCKKNGIQF